MSGLLLAELIMVKKQMSRKLISAIAAVDVWYGVFSLLVVGIGLTLWFGVGKGVSFYDNPVLHVKVGIVVIIGILSIWPTVYFIRKRKGDPDEQVSVPPVAFAPGGVFSSFTDAVAVLVQPLEPVIVTV